MKKIICCIMLIPFLLIGCSKKEVNTEYEKVEELLGTVITAKVYGENGEEALEAAFNRVKEIEDTMSVKKEDSEITEVNNNAYKEEVEISEDLYFVIEKALYYAELTNGALDPSLGKIVDLWGIGTENARVPSLEELTPLIGKRNYKNIILNKEKSTVRFLDPNIKLDLGAIAKGYAADEMKDILCNEYNIKNGMLNLGGNVMAIGTKLDGSLWKVGITDPINNEKVYGAVSIDDKTVVTSGNYERYFIENGIRYHHIIDPSNGCPSNAGIISSTIICNKSIDADALSTSTYILGKDKALELIEGLEDFEGIFIEENGEVWTTSGITSDIFEVINNEE